MTDTRHLPPEAAHSPTHLTVRRLMIDLAPGFDRHWNGGDAFMTAYCNALSMSFPLGEQFFIDSVKSGLKHLPDTPENQGLRDAAKGFIGQEATHRHLHGLYNAHLTRQGLKNHWEVRAKIRQDRARQMLFEKSPRGYLHELAVTAAFEHLTSIFGDLTLERVGQDGDWFQHAQEPMRTLWRWHAAEESEHKCVSFDLYQRLGGNHRWRMRWFRFVLLQFSTDVIRQTVNNLWHDGTLFKFSTWRSGLKFAFGRHGLLWRVLRPIRAYARQDFHPLQVGHPTRASDWLQAHAGEWKPVNSAA